MPTPAKLYSPRRLANAWMPVRLTAPRVSPMFPRAMAKFSFSTRIRRMRIAWSRKSPHIPVPRPWATIPKPAISLCPAAIMAPCRCWSFPPSPDARAVRLYCASPAYSLDWNGRSPGGGMADAEDLKSSGDFSSCGFDSHPGHHHFSFNKAILSPLLLIWSSIVVLESDSHQCLQQPACLPQGLRPLNFPYL